MASRGYVCLGLGFGLLVAACGGDDFSVTPIYDQGTGRVVVKLSRALESDETLHVRTRRGTLGSLDCRTQLAQIPPLDRQAGERHIGPPVDPALLKPFYGPEWAEAPTPEMLAQLELGTDSIVDVCLVNAGGELVRQVEMDLMRAWDNGRREGLGGKADDPSSGETRIHSAQEYGVRCVAELGEIPFFEKTGEGSYSTYNCLDSTPIPMTVTDAAGNVEHPEGTASKCDKPQYIYSLCEQGPRVAERTNDQGTRWVLLCRKSIGGLSSAKFNDIAMIGHNPYTGKSCFFQNALYSKTDGEHVPHPADVEKSSNLWSGVHGGVGSGIECAKCHDADPFIHTPWIDGAKDAQGRPIVPKMGVDEDYPIGANDAPYSIVNLRGQGWSMPEQLVSPEANACLRCHRIGRGRWLDWATRLDGTDPSFKNITTDEYLKFHHRNWMPPELEGVDESNWASSEVGRALEFIKGCGRNESGCQWAEIPGASGGGGGGGNGKLRNPVDMPNAELATRALVILGANVPESSNRCNECHSLTRSNLKEWRVLTDRAVASCLATTSGGTSEMQSFPEQTVARDELKSYGPFEVAAGGTFRVTMTGSGDADLFVRKNQPVTTSEYDCRPYASGSEEMCGPEQFDAVGPGQFYVGISGFADTSTVTLNVVYTRPGETQVHPRTMVDCMRLDPTRPDSPFTPVNLGIYSAAAHLDWFKDLFQAAYPLGENGNTPFTWANEYAKFRLRVSMPKGNHPRFTQEELDIVAEWYARGLPNLESALPDDPPPSSCTPSITPELSAHVAAMRTNGWKAQNAERGMTMLDLGGFPRASSKSYAAGWEALPGAELRVLRELAFGTHFWMRSSADGRFVANGATNGAGAAISDLARDVDIPTHAAYDPGFFPDGSGFVFQGTSIGAGFCNTSLLTSNPSEINFSEPQCSSATNVGLYQHLGAGLDGRDYFVVTSQFVSDNGGHSSTTRDPSASFSSQARMKLVPMIHNGTIFTEGTPVSVDSPFEGDTVLSPSTLLAISRLAGPGDAQLGFVIRRVDAQKTATGYDISAPVIGRICVQGGKPALSFDERYMAYHHYNENGSADIYLADLLTGQTTRITAMQPGQYALYPHFRSDGWVYFLVRDANSSKEYAVAGNAAIVLAQ